MIDKFKKLPSILARWIPCTDYLRAWTYNFQRGWLTFTGLGQLSCTPETEDHILPVPTAVCFISENIFIVCLWFILSAFSNNHCSPPNPGYRRVLILVVSICKLRSRFLGHRSLCGSFLELNGSSKAVGSPTCLSTHWVGLPLGHGVERIFYFFSWVLRVLSPRYQSVVSLSTFVVCSWRSGMET